MIDLKDIRGQENIKRALEIAVTGNHPIVIVGTPKWEVQCLHEAFQLPKENSIMTWMQPCRCNREECICKPESRRGWILNHRDILLRADIVVEIVQTPITTLLGARDAEPTESVQARIYEAMKKFPGGVNPGMNLVTLNKLAAKIDQPSLEIIKTAFQKLRVPSDRILNVFNVARTISIIDSGGNLRAEHFAEAIQYSSFITNLFDDSWLTR